MKEYKETLLCLADGSACGILSLTFVFLLAGFLGKINPSCLFYDIKLTDCFTVILASITVLATINEYNAHRKREKAEVLGQYNERYSRDEHINKVVDYIIRYMDNNYVNPLPSVHDAEMFMRFFEEMEIQIKENRMDAEYVCRLFSYYAIKVGDDELIRHNLGITDYDEGNEWEKFKSFVVRMKKIKNNSQNNESVVPTTTITLSIEDIYNDVIKNSTKWKYYNFNPSIESFKDVYEEPEKLIKDFLFVSEKYKSGDLYNCFKILREKEHEPTNKELNGRLRHIVSLFFLGHVLYENIPVIKSNIDQQFKQFIENGMFSNENNSEDNLHKLFSFMWFLLCIFHDFGYAYEKGLIPEQQNLAELNKPDHFLPEIYSKENINRYARYRECVFGCKDHGIFGGKVFCQGMKEIGKQIAINPQITNLFKTDKVDSIYQYAAWVIACHNIFFVRENDKNVNCYKCQGLECFINSKARCITLKKNPLLFLFCFADSIEPTKTLRSKTNDNKTDYEIYQSLYMAFDKNKNIIRFDLSRIKYSEVQEKYMKNILGLNDWLVDISNDLTIIFE